MSDPRTTSEGFDAFVSETGPESCRHEFVEMILLCFFEIRPVTGWVRGVEVYERRFRGEPLLMDRANAAVVGRELLAAGAPADGGSPDWDRG